MIVNTRCERAASNKDYSEGTLVAFGEGTRGIRLIRGSSVSVAVSISDLVGRLGQRNASERASRKDYR